MDTTIKAWLGQSTTGQGIAGLLTIFAAVASGAMTWQSGLVSLVPAVVLIVWPQNIGLAKAAGTLTSDVEAILPLVLSAFNHGVASGRAAAAVVQGPAANANVPEGAGAGSSIGGAIVTSGGSGGAAAAPGSAPST
jgi:hypothetical protein